MNLTYNLSSLHPLCKQVIYNPPSILIVIIPLSFGVLLSTYVWVKLRELKKEKYSKDLAFLEWLNVGVFIVLQVVFIVMGYYF